MYKRQVQYGVNEQGLIDYDEVERLALEHKPKMVVAGFSAYSQVVDWARFRAIADKVGAYLFVDMAHVAGLIAAGVYPSPVPHAHVVTSTTHKTPVSYTHLDVYKRQTSPRSNPNPSRTMATCSTYLPANSIPGAHCAGGVHAARSSTPSKIANTAPPSSGHASPPSHANTAGTQASSRPGKRPDRDRERGMRGFNR